MLLLALSLTLSLDCTCLEINRMKPFKIIRTKEDTCSAQLLICERIDYFILKIMLYQINFFSHSVCDRLVNSIAYRCGFFEINKSE